MGNVPTRWANNPSPGDVLYTASFQLLNSNITMRVYWYGMPEVVHDSDANYEVAYSAVKLAYPELYVDYALLEAGHCTTMPHGVALRPQDVRHLGEDHVTTLKDLHGDNPSTLQCQVWVVFGQIVLLYKTSPFSDDTVFTAENQ